MNCPVCQKELTEAIEKPHLSEEEEHLISNLPYVIAFPLKRALTEKHPFPKMKECAEIDLLQPLKGLSAEAVDEAFKDFKVSTEFKNAVIEKATISMTVS